MQYAMGQEIIPDVSERQDGVHILIWFLIVRNETFQESEAQMYE